MSLIQHRSCATKCLNPNPIYERPKEWRPLPGELGKAFNFCKKRDISRDPIFIQSKQKVGRSRKFRQERRALINAFFQMCLSRHDLVTGVLELDLQAMSVELSKIMNSNGEIVYAEVPVCRISRLINEVLIPFGLCYYHEQRKWDNKNKQWYPNTIVLTDNFYRVCGVDIIKIEHQRQQQLRYRAENLAGEHEVLSVAQARERKHQQILQRSAQKRMQNKERKQTQKKLKPMNIDERKEYVAERMVQLSPQAASNVPYQTFTQDVWSTLNLLDLGVSSLKPH